MTQTASAQLTQPGTILGTLQYMAPEQLEGKEADARTDIFALGAILYEKLTGRKAFEANSRASLIAAILEREPQPIASSDPPSALDHAVLLCLAKYPNNRWQDARDLQRELEWIAEGGGRPTPLATPRRPVPWMWIVAGLIVLSAVALFSVFHFTSSRREDWRAVKLALPPPDNMSFESLALSPDGRNLAFTATDSSGVRRLWVRRLDSLASQLFQSSEAAEFPFWSPDSHSIGFFAAGTGTRQIWRIPAAGGKAVPFTREDGSFMLIDSLDSKTLYYTKGPGRKLFRSAADGSGETELLSGVDYWGFAVAPDRIYYLHEPSAGSIEIRRHLLATGEDSRVAAIDKPLTMGLSLSPDGKSLIYSELRLRGNVMLAENLF